MPGALQPIPVEPIPFSTHTPHFFWLPAVKTLAAVLQKPAKLFVEMSTRQELEKALGGLQDGTPDFGLSLTNRSAYNPHICSLS